VGGEAGAVAAPVCLRQHRVVPFSWQTGVTHPRQRMPGQSIFKPRSDARSDWRGRIGGGRCLGILPKPSRKARHRAKSHPVAPSPVFISACGVLRSSPGYRGKRLVAAEKSSWLQGKVDRAGLHNDACQKPSGVVSLAMRAMPSGMVRHLRVRICQADRAASARS
jgi:hypothetical protein